MSNASNNPAATPPAQRDHLTGKLVGTVVSDKRAKTRTVAVEWQYRHPKYGKYLKRATNYHVHDEQNVSKLGDQVEIANCRPISKTKCYRLLRVIKAGVGPEVAVAGQETQA